MILIGSVRKQKLNRSLDILIPKKIREIKRVFCTLREMESTMISRDFDGGRVA